jgi:hypothetical protein
VFVCMVILLVILFTATIVYDILVLLCIVILLVILVTATIVYGIVALFMVQVHAKLK